MRKTIVILFFLMFALLAGSGGVHSQDPIDPPPQVIDVWPLPGVELSPNEPITITFNEAMDQASVESAFQLDPVTAGTFVWSDARTVDFTPTGGWPRNMTYVATIAASAQASNGLTLEDAVQFDLKTVGPLNVSSVVPEPDAEGVAADARIVVTFNRPVVPLVSTEELADLPSPITIEPALEGKGEWLNTGIFVFTPDAALRGGTEYTVTVASGLSSVDGAVLADPYSWSFETLPPQILNITPYSGQTQVLLENPISVTFSQPMDTASVEQAFALLHNGNRVEGSFSWDATNAYLTFAPTQNLEIESLYVVNIGDSARSAGGDATLDRGYSQSFNTVPYPGVDSTSPENGERDVYPGWGATIYFKSPMNTDTLEGKIEISPETEWQPTIWSNQSLNLDFHTLPNTTYTITLRAGAEDLYGNPIETDYTFSYSTGPISTWARPLTNYRTDLLITGAHRDNTRISMQVSGTPKVNFRLYTIEKSQLPDVMRENIQHGGYYYYDVTPYWVNDEHLLRAWTQTFDSQGREGVAREVLLASENGGTLPNGVYWLYIEVDNSSNNNDVYQFPLAVATANLTVKRTSEETLVWVTDMPTAAPVQETTITIYHNSTAIARGQTDAQGVFRAPVELPENDELVFIEAEGAGAYGAWYSYYENEPPTEQNYIYTDRPIYRPGETVYFRGVLRDRDDMDYSVPNLRSVNVSITAVDGTEIFREALPVTEFGTFSGELELAEDVAIGDAYITLDSEVVVDYYYYGYAGYFTIAEFRVPEFEVGVTAQQDEIFLGDPLNAVSQADYYFGGGVSNAQVTWSAYGSSGYFNYTGPGSYSFYDEAWEYLYYQYIGDGSGTTDSSGSYLITATNTNLSTPQPMLITVETTVTDESFQAISGRTTVMAHPANLYVGLRSDTYFGNEGRPVTFDMIAVDTESNSLAEKQLDLEIVEVRWSRVPIEGQFGQYSWVEEEIPVATDSVRTDANGQASYEFTPPNAGIFRIRASGMDERELRNSSTLRLWVFGSQPVWWGEPTPTLDMIPDKDSYQPGDTAQILIPIPFAGRSTVLLSTERAGIISYEVIEVEGSTLVYELPIIEEHVPTVHLTAMLVKGIDEESLNPDYRSGSIALSVEPVEQRLNVTITPSRDQAQPGESITLDIEITDSNGNPVQSELGLVLTDKAILALTNPNSASLEDTYYGYQGDYTITGISIEALLDRITDEAVVDVVEEAAAPPGMAADGAVAQNEFAPMPTTTATSSERDASGQSAGEAQQPPEVRENFQQTPLWEAHIVTDAEGKATVSVDLPDNLTTWALDARALTVETEVGQANAEIVVSLPLLVRPVAPRFFVVGDRVQLASVINNNTGSEQTVEATLQATGVELESPATQTVTIPAGSRARVEWMVVAQDVPFVDLTYLAIGPNGFQDATKPTLATGPDGTIPVYRYTAPDHVGTAGILRGEGSRVEGISLPARFDDSQGDLVIHADPSLAATTIDSLDYLENFPHQCIEQTVSRFLPNVVTYRALKNLGISDPQLEANLFIVLSEALQRLALEQNADGGWGWFSGMESNPLVTAYAALGLIEAREAGFEIDASMVDRALNFVRSDFVRPGINSSSWELNRQAFYLYVLARNEQGEQRLYDELYNIRLNMSHAGRAYLLMAYHERFPEAGAINDLVSDLTTAAIVSATGTHWEEESIDWWNWSSDTRTTALALLALTRTTPESELLPNAVRWLMVARNGDHWETTQENVWGVIALTDWMLLTGELQGDYDYNLNLNREGIAEGTVTPDNVREGQELRIAISDLLKDEVNRLVISRDEGPGALYYTAHLNLRLYASEVDELSRGVTVKRQYFLDGDPENPITSAAIGDTITVRLTITLPQDIYYFVLEDPIPAGTEGVDTNLLTTSQLAEGPSLAPVGDEWFWYWGWWWFDRTEMRDEQVNLYADFLPQGTYTYTYQIRASVAGEFQTMPAQGYAFYFPEVFGRTDGTLFTVLPAEESAEE